MENIKPQFPVIPALDGYCYLDELKLYYAYFGSIPSVKRIHHLNLTAVSAWIQKELGFIQVHYSSVKKIRLGRGNGDYMIDMKYFVIDHHILAKLEDDVFSILFDNEQEARADSILEKAGEFRLESSKNHIHLVISTAHGLETERIKFQEPVVELEKHYNDDLKPIHEKLIQTLKEDTKSGLILLYGMPGTGKSTYIRSLICGQSKKVIFLTPELAGSLGSPEISKFLIRNAGSIFVIEDAEQLLVSRDSGRKSSISTILNLTDGILGESLGIQIIATFNSDLYSIDKALLRKGRMLALYEFKPLDVLKTSALLSELGLEHVDVTKPMTLADIYNYNESSYEIAKSRNGIGFKN